ncbi:MAG: PilZ domain-containing protein [Oligoflexales bacterium]
MSQKNEETWYVYHQNNQLGPFGPKHIIQLLDHSIISLDAWVFRGGWKEWKPLKDHHSEVLAAATQAPEVPITEQPPAAPRTIIDGRVIFHNQGDIAFGKGVNISTSGIFIEAFEKPFDHGEHLRLTCQVNGFLKSFNAQACVIRFNDDPRFPKGYGLQFENIDHQVLQQIEMLLQKEQKKSQIQETQIATVATS